MASQLTARLDRLCAPVSFVICGAGLLPVGAAATADRIRRCVSGSCSQSGQNHVFSDCWSRMLQSGVDPLFYAGMNVTVDEIVTTMKLVSNYRYRF